MEKKKKLKDVSPKKNTARRGAREIQRKKERRKKQTKERKEREREREQEKIYIYSSQLEKKTRSAGFERTNVEENRIE